MLNTLSYDELRELLAKVDAFAWPVLDTFPKQRTVVENAQLEFCRRMWIDLNNAQCKVLQKETKRGVR